MKTRITELLGIERPIIMAAMAWIGDIKLAAAVTKAGGLGTLGPNAGQVEITRDVVATGERQRKQIRQLRSRTDKPFAINFVVGVPGLDRDFSDRCVEVGIEEQAPVAIVSQGDPKVYTKRLKDAGIKVLHTCSSVEHARKAEAAGVDAVIATGFEGGGHSGFFEVTTFCLVPQVVDAVKIPVIAAGGIGDGRGLVAALALGAEAVYIGTRFIATRECFAHSNVKKLILDSNETSSIALRHGMSGVAGPGDRGFKEERRGTLRMLVDDQIRAALEREGYTYEALAPFMVLPSPEKGGSSTAASLVHGEVANRAIMAGGQVVGMINDIPSCKQLIKRIMDEAEGIIEGLGAKVWAR
jgi:enoyl-[acyl-carrier protein] reductase II